MKRLQRPEVLTAIGLLLVLLMLAGGAAFYVYQRHTAVDEQLTHLEPRYARLLGLQGSAATLDNLTDEAQKTLAKYVYPAGKEKTQAGTDAQQAIRETFTKAGLEIISSQTLPPKPGKFFERIPLTVRVEGDIIKLQAALVVLASLTPVVLVDSFTVQTVGLVRADTAQRLTSQFEFTVLRAQP